MTVLLTGFEPFEGQSVNASWLAVRTVAEAWSGPPLHVVQLPVSFARAPLALRAALAAEPPDVVVCVGEAGDRSVVSLERVALNVADARIADNDGARPVDDELVPGGPVAYLTTLPIRECLRGLAAANVPGEVSNSAGTYVCNTVFYTLARSLEGSGVPFGFVHVPRTPAQVAATAQGVRGTGMPTELAARGLASVLEACLRL